MSRGCQLNEWPHWDTHYLGMMTRTGVLQDCPSIKILLPTTN